MQKRLRFLAFAALALGSVGAVAGAQTIPTAQLFPVTPLSAVDTTVTETVLDRAALAAEDLAREAAGLPPRFALAEAVDFSPDSWGTWEPLPDGRWLWRLRVFAPGASSVNLGFGRFRLTPKARLLLYSGDGKQIVRPFTAEDNESHGELWTPIVSGPDLVVELTLPDAERGRVELRLTSINLGYRGFGAIEAPESGSCNMDVECLNVADPWREVSRAVGVISTGGSTFCTGSLLNNTALDRKMLFMTAAHCGINSGNAASLVVYWNYQNSTCRVPGSPQSGQPGDGTLAQFHTGSFFRASYSPSDFTLVELDDPPVAAFNHYWAGWDRTPYVNPGGPGNGDHACTSASLCAAIHHPDTDEKRITFSETNTTTTSYNNPAIPGDGSHVHAYWDDDPVFPPNPSLTIPPGVTEPGSSGSPLYNAERRFIGQLHGGPSACGATGENLSDYYGRLSVSWDRAGSTASNRVKDYLDPLGTNPLTLDGRPFCATPPAAPTGLAVVPNGDNRLDLAWNVAAGATSYRLLRAEGTCASGAPFALLASGVVATSYSDLTVSGGSTYAYKVVAYDDAAGCESAASGCAEGQATGPCTLAPSFAGLASVSDASEAGCAIDLDWSAGTARCGSAVVYNVYRSTDPNFTPGPSNLLAGCLLHRRHTDFTALAGTTYHYAVRAEDAGGSGSGACAGGLADGNSVRKSAAASGPDAVVFFDDLESGAANWATGGGTPDWTLVTSDSHSPTHSYFVPDPTNSIDRRLRTAAPIALPAASPLRLEFWQRYAFEGTSTRYDGGVLETSTDAVAWADILAGNPNRFLANGYNGTLSTCCGNPLGGRAAFTGAQASWLATVVDLDDFAGTSLYLGWRIGTDTSVSAAGWWIDDVRLTYDLGCVASTRIFRDGFETGSFAAWDGGAP